MPSIILVGAALSAATYFWPWKVLFLAVGLFLTYLFWHLLWRLRLRKSYYPAISPAEVTPASALSPNFRPLRRRVCVIGAGPSGLVTVKELLDEGHEVTCFEKYEDIGGVFLFKPHKGGVYDSTILTISNFFMVFSDFFPKSGRQGPKPYRYWHHSEYFQYLQQYCQHFQLQERAQFYMNTKVESISRRDNKWFVQTSGGVNQEFKFDAIAVCNGTHQIANIPKFEGQETSDILICHSESYKNAKEDPRLKGKRVVCIGVGETAADVAAEIGDNASQAWLAMRRPPHIVPRYPWNMNYPGDAFSSRAMFYCNHDYIDAIHLQDQTAKYATGFNSVAQKIFRGAYGLGDPVMAKVADLAFRSGGGVTRQFLTKSDRFIPHLLNGKLTEKPGIAKLQGRTVIFTDASRVDNVDTIMCCTGYRDEFPFLKGITLSNIRDLYKHAFHPELGSTIAWIGFVRPSTGGVPFCSEMVARYYAMILSGKRKLPDNLHTRILEDKKTEEGVLYLHAQRIRSLVLWGDYVESIAAHIGCTPHLITYLFTNPLLWFRMMYGPMIPAQYRLKGPHANPELSKELLREVPMVTPTMFSLVQSISAVLGWIGGSLFNFRATSW